MDLKIINATLDDQPIIYQLFEEAMLFQQKNNYIGWANYDKDFIRADIEKGLLYKIIADEYIICTFSVCYSDALIWRQKEKGDAMYLHRVVIDQHYKGGKLFQKVWDWAIDAALEKNLKYLRIDTWAENAKLINYYKGYGFAFIENYKTSNTADLPIQHRNLNVALLQYTIQKEISLEKVNIIQQLATIDQYWSQKIIGTANGQLIKLAKGMGEINWHKHDDQDELFILYKGHLTIQLRTKNIQLFPNEMFIVPKGIEHCPIANVHSEFLIMGLNITSNAAGGRPEREGKMKE